MKKVFFILAILMHQSSFAMTKEDEKEILTQLFNKVETISSPSSITINITPVVNSTGDQNLYNLFTPKQMIYAAGGIFILGSLMYVYKKICSKKTHSVQKMQMIINSHGKIRQLKMDSSSHSPSMTMRMSY